MGWNAAVTHPRLRRIMLALSEPLLVSDLNGLRTSVDCRARGSGEEGH
jgi:hypothetical protein